MFIGAKLHGLAFFLSFEFQAEEGEALAGLLGGGQAWIKLDDPLELALGSEEILAVLDVEVGGEVEPADHVFWGLAGFLDELFELFEGEVKTAEVLDVEEGEFFAGLIVPGMELELLHAALGGLFGVFLGRLEFGCI